MVEGICIPLDVRHDLVRNVTTRGRGRDNTCIYMTISFGDDYIEFSRVTAAAFPLASEYDTASSPARDHACVCVCFILCDRLPRTVYRVRHEPSPSLASLPSTYCELEL